MILFKYKYIYVIIQGIRETQIIKELILVTVPGPPEAICCEYGRFDHTHSSNRAPTTTS